MRAVSDVVLICSCDWRIVIVIIAKQDGPTKGPKEGRPANQEQANIGVTLGQVIRLVAKERLDKDQWHHAGIPPRRADGRASAVIGITVQPEEWQNDPLDQLVQ